MNNMQIEKTPKKGSEVRMALKIVAVVFLVIPVVMVVGIFLLYLGMGMIYGGYEVDGSISNPEHLPLTKENLLQKIYLNLLSHILKMFKYCCLIKFAYMPC